MNPVMQKSNLHGAPVFLSASFPSPERDAKYYKNADNHEITNAVLALINAVFTANGRLVFGGHPTISPLALHQATMLFVERDKERDKERVRIYQSLLFKDQYTEDALEIAASNFGQMIETQLVTGEDGTQTRALSLREMRTRMLQESKPVAAVFVGGMEGVEDEFRLCAELFPAMPRYLVAAPGGAAALLAKDHALAPPDSSDQLRKALANAYPYPFVMKLLVEDISQRIRGRRLN